MRVLTILVLLMLASLSLAAGPPPQCSLPAGAPAQCSLAEADGDVELVAFRRGPARRLARTAAVLPARAAVVVGRAAVVPARVLAAPAVRVRRAGGGC